MTFEELYGERLDHELGSADRTERFTLVRRKAAINIAQKEFVRLTDCFQREVQIDLVNGLTEYDLEAVINDEAFLRFVDQQPWVKITEGTAKPITRGGDDFPRRDISLRDREDPGWREAGSSQPGSWYLREDGGRMLFGVSPSPIIAVGSAWQVFIPYSAYPADMVNAADVPFSTSAGGDSKMSLRIYHQALVHHAASTLEKLRRNYPQMNLEMGIFRDFVNDYLARRQPTGGTRVSLARSYFRDAQRHHSDADRDPRR